MSDIFRLENPGIIRLSSKIKQPSEWKTFAARSQKKLTDECVVMHKSGEQSTVILDITQTLYISTAPILAKNNPDDVLLHLVLSLPNTKQEAYVTNGVLVSLYRHILNNSWLLLGQMTEEETVDVALIHLMNTNTTFYVVLDAKDSDKVFKYIVGKK